MDHFHFSVSFVVRGFIAFVASGPGAPSLSRSLKDIKQYHIIYNTINNEMISDSMVLNFSSSESGGALRSGGMWGSFEMLLSGRTFEQSDMKVLTTLSWRWLISPPCLHLRACSTEKVLFLQPLASHLRGRSERGRFSRIWMLSRNSMGDNTVLSYSDGKTESHWPVSLLRLI